MAHRQMLALCSALLVATGCSTPVEDMVAEWKKQGHTVGPFKSVTEHVPEGGKCSAGTVGGFSATLCEFDSDASALGAEEAGFDLIEGGVGTSVAAGKTLLVLSDPRKEDGSGRRMNEVVRAFREKMK